MESLWVHVVVPVVAALVLNGIIFSLKWNDANNTKTNTYLPPGYIIGIIWVIILGVLGALHYRVKGTVASYFVAGLITFCLSYPFMTAGLQSGTWASILNLITLVLAFVTCIVIPKPEIGYMIPILIWSGYVNLAQLLMPNCK